MPIPTLSFDEEINNADAETSPVTFNVLKVPRRVTFGCWGVIKCPPRALPLKVPTEVRLPATRVAMPSVRSETLKWLAESMLYCPTEEEMPTEDVIFPVTFRRLPSKVKLASALMPLESILVIMRLSPGLVYSSIIPPPPPPPAEEVRIILLLLSKAR